MLTVNNLVEDLTTPTTVEYDGVHYRVLRRMFVPLPVHDSLLETLHRLKVEHTFRSTSGIPAIEYVFTFDYSSTPESPSLAEFTGVLTVEKDGPLNVPVILNSLGVTDRLIQVGRKLVAIHKAQKRNGKFDSIYTRQGYHFPKHHVKDD